MMRAVPTSTVKRRRRKQYRPVLRPTPQQLGWIDARERIGLIIDVHMRAGADPELLGALRWL
jgi:hypothetical protein